MYGVDHNGTEHNFQFASENDWIADISSFHSGKPSRLYIEAIEQSVILQIDATNLVYLYHNHPKFDRIFRVVAENKFIELQTGYCRTSAQQVTNVIRLSWNSTLNWTTNYPILK